MKLWTIQTLAAWQYLQQHKILTVQPDFIFEEFRNAYDWMSQQLQKHDPQPNQHISYPIWAWHQWIDQQRAKPDLRFKAHLPSGTQGVRLLIEIPDQQVLLSDFDLWHCVLNNGYLTDSFDDKVVDDMEKQDSWQRIFDLDWHAEDFSFPRPHKSIQAVFWQLHESQVLDIDYFTAR